MSNSHTSVFVEDFNGDSVDALRWSDVEGERYTLKVGDVTFFIAGEDWAAFRYALIGALNDVQPARQSKVSR